jgi:hypothetical protein
MGCLTSSTTPEATINLNLGGGPTTKGSDEVKAAKTGNFAIAESTDGEIIQTQGSKKKLDKKANFIEHILREINKCRTDPSSFANTVEQHVQFIFEENGHYFYIRQGMPKIALKRGSDAFYEVAEKLRSMAPLNKLELKEELQVSISDNQEEWAKKEYIANAINEAKHKLKESATYKNFQFHFDIGSPLSENSFILQLVDDTAFKGARSKNILNPDFKFVGISTKKEKNKNCSYYLFAY